jgi:hypothetical protein
MTISCSGYEILHTEVAPDFMKEPTNDFQVDGVNYTHEAVIHDPNFVNPDIHTQNIENMWMRVKRKLRRQFGTSREPFLISMEELIMSSFEGIYV